MISIIINCPNTSCNKTYSFDEEFIGREIACPVCGTAMRITAPVTNRSEAKNESDGLDHLVVADIKLVEEPGASAPACDFEVVDDIEEAPASDFEVVNETEQAAPANDFAVVEAPKLTSGTPAPPFAEPVPPSKEPPAPANIASSQPRSKKRKKRGSALSKLPTFSVFGFVITPLRALVGVAIIGTLVIGVVILQSVMKSNEAAKDPVERITKGMKESEVESILAGLPRMVESKSTSYVTTDFRTGERSRTDRQVSKKVYYLDKERNRTIIVDFEDGKVTDIQIGIPRTANPNPPQNNNPDQKVPDLPQGNPPEKKLETSPAKLAQQLKTATIAELIVWLNDAPIFTRRQVAEELSRRGAEAKDAVPQLVQCMESSDKVLQVFAADALWFIDRNPAALQVLLEAIESDAKAAQSANNNPLPRYTKAVISVGNIGPDAKAALPTLRQVASGFNPNLRRIAKESIEKIEGKNK